MPKARGKVPLFVKAASTLYYYILYNFSDNQKETKKNMATPTNLSTPRRTKKRHPLNHSPALNISSTLLEVNDDIQEKKQRRKSKLLTTSILSPGGVQASPSRQGLADKDRYHNKRWLLMILFQNINLLRMK